MTITNIDADFDSWATPGPSESEVAADLFVSFAGTVSQLRFPLSALAAAASVSDSTLQFNVTLTSADAGEGANVQAYNNSGDDDPDNDDAATKLARSSGGSTLVSIECSSNGSKTGDLGTTADVQILGNVSSPGFYSLALNNWNQDYSESVRIEAIENAGTDPATLTVVWEAATPVEGTAEGSLQSFTADASGTHAQSGSASGSLRKFSAVATGVMVPSGTTSATVNSITAAAVGTHAQIGSASATLQPLTADAAGIQTQTGTAAATIQGPTADAAGTHTQSGTSTGGLQTFTASASGVMVPEGTASASLRNLTADATASHGQTGTTSVELQQFSAAAVGEIPTTGAVTITLSRITALGDGYQLVPEAVGYEITYGELARLPRTVPSRHLGPHGSRRHRERR